jgi:cob(I)alamin adenosyltransferase
MSIATKTGDDGETSLMYGRRVPKTDQRVDAYGSIDELNSALGLARASVTDGFLNEQIFAVQKELVVVMGELATAPEDLERYQKDGFQLTTSVMTDRLTALVDDLEKNRLGKFKGWSTPGETMGSAALDVARTTCRRGERRVAELMAADPHCNREILRYLNRLSDVCWLLARYAEQHPDPAKSVGEKG